MDYTLCLRMFYTLDVIGHNFGAHSKFDVYIASFIKFPIHISEISLSKWSNYTYVISFKEIWNIKL